MTVYLEKYGGLYVEEVARDSVKLSRDFHTSDVDEAVGENPPLGEEQMRAIRRRIAEGRLRNIIAASGM